MDRAPERAWDEDGLPAIGTWRGELESLSYDDWTGLDRVKRQKRWLWCGAMTDEVAVGAAIVRTGYAANVFVWVFDRTAHEFLEDVSRVLPPPAASVADYPNDGHVARYRGLLEGLSVERDGSRWNLAGRIADVRLDLEIDERAEPITAICPVPRTAEESDQNVQQSINVTRKQARAACSGAIRVGTRRIAVDGAGFLDFSHGMLARETIWNWAIGAGTTASGKEIGFNLVSQFNEGLENVVWTEGGPRYVGPVRFDTADETWSVQGNGIELSLGIAAIRSQDLDLGLVVSEYVQPLGPWRGTIDGESFEGAGVAEYHRSVW